MDTTFKEMMIKHRDINATKAVVDKPQLCDVCELLDAIDEMQDYIQTGKNLGALSSYIARVITVSKKVRANFA